MAYTPGVGRVVKAIAQDPSKAFTLTSKSNAIAVVTDGTAILGLGNLGTRSSSSCYGRESHVIPPIRRH